MKSIEKAIAGSRKPYILIGAGVGAVIGLIAYVKEWI